MSVCHWYCFTAIKPSSSQESLIWFRWICLNKTIPNNNTTSSFPWSNISAFHSDVKLTVGTLLVGSKADNNVIVWGRQGWGRFWVLSNYILLSPFGCQSALELLILLEKQGLLTENNVQMLEEVCMNVSPDLLETVNCYKRAKGEKFKSQGVGLQKCRKH